MVINVNQPGPLQASPCIFLPCDVASDESARDDVRATCHLPKLQQASPADSCPSGGDILCPEVLALHLHTWLRSRDVCAAASALDLTSASAMDTTAALLRPELLATW